MWRSSMNLPSRKIPYEKPTPMCPVTSSATNCGPATTASKGKHNTQVLEGGRGCLDKGSWNVYTRVQCNQIGLKRDFSHRFRRRSLFVGGEFCWNTRSEFAKQCSHCRLRRSWYLEYRKYTNISFYGRFFTANRRTVLHLDRKRIYREKRHFTQISY